MVLIIDCTIHNCTIICYTVRRSPVIYSYSASKPNFHATRTYAYRVKCFGLFDWPIDAVGSVCYPKRAQVQALEATAYPGVAAEVPEEAREFLETESATALGGRDTNTSARQGPDATTEACLGVGGTLDGVIERLVVYPARNGHASYHMPKRCVRVSWCWKASLNTFCLSRIKGDHGWY